jgi:allophanate hydrolase subunit 2
VPLGPDHGRRRGLDAVPVRPPPADPVLRVHPGPRLDRFSPSALASLVSASWRVDPQSNRVGLRLSGPPLDRLVHDELPPEGAVTGSLQVPPSGQPMLFLADHPVTGGYPVIAVVDDADLPAAGQLPPGAVVRFAVASPRA